MGVDELVGDVADLLLSAGALDSTYILSTSDHGFHLGEWRMPMFKAQPYETDINVPFLIRGPGIQPGRTLQGIGLNIDIAPTIAALIGTVPPPAAKVDGQSLLPLLFGGASTAWREDFLFEFWAGGQPGGAVAREYVCDHVMMAPNNTYAGVRTAAGLKYVEFDEPAPGGAAGNMTEMYDIAADPHEMANLAADPAGGGAARAALQHRLAMLRRCSEDGCRA